MTMQKQNNMTPAEAKTASRFTLLAWLVFGSALYCYFEGALLCFLGGAVILAAKGLMSFGLFALVHRWGGWVVDAYKKKSFDLGVLPALGIILAIGACLISFDHSGLSLTLTGKRSGEADRTWDVHTAIIGSSSDSDLDDPRD